MTDLVITNANLVDGSGAPARIADIAVSDGRIVDVAGRGQLGTTGKRVIDAQGLLVTPGFVDIHTHYDAQVSWDPMLTPSSWHGVTTAVMGNCGVGFAPAHPDRHQWLIELMEGVEDIPGAAMTDGMNWQWESFPEYLDSVDNRKYVIDVGTQIAHGALRAYVMGQRGADNEPANADDCVNMARLVEEALRAGALGFSTSRTPLHKSKSGELVPGTMVDPAELYAIADAMVHECVVTRCFKQIQYRHRLMHTHQCLFVSFDRAMNQREVCAAAGLVAKCDRMKAAVAACAFHVLRPAPRYSRFGCGNESGRQSCRS